MVCFRGAWDLTKECEALFRAGLKPPLEVGEGLTARLEPGNARPAISMVRRQV